MQAPSFSSKRSRREADSSDFGNARVYCRLEGCDKPAHVGRGGTASEFCRLMHYDIYMANLAMRSARDHEPELCTDGDICKLPYCAKLVARNTESGESFDFCSKGHSRQFSEFFIKKWSEKGRLCQFVACCHHIRVNEPSGMYSKYCDLHSYKLMEDLAVLEGTLLAPEDQFPTEESALELAMIQHLSSLLMDESLAMDTTPAVVIPDEILEEILPMNEAEIVAASVDGEQADGRDQQNGSFVSSDTELERGFRGIVETASEQVRFDEQRDGSFGSAVVPMTYMESGSGGVIESEIKALLEAVKLDLTIDCRNIQSHIWQKFAVGVDIRTYHPWDLVTGSVPRFFFYVYDHKLSSKRFSRSTKEGFKWKQSGPPEKPKADLKRTYFNYELETKKALAEDIVGEPACVKAYQLHAKSRASASASESRPDKSTKGIKRWRMHEFTLLNQEKPSGVIWKVFQDLKGRPEFPPMGISCDAPSSGGSSSE